MQKFIIFDWDGTLGNSVEKITQCMQHIAKCHNLHIPSEDEVKAILGKNLSVALTESMHINDSAILPELENEFITTMQTDEYQAELFPGTHKMLSDLKSHGFKLAVATAKSRAETDSTIRFNKLDRVFDCTACTEEHQAKPNPEMLYYLMDQLDVMPQQGFMVGDADLDIHMGNNAGLNSIGVTFGAHDLEKLEDANPMAMISNWDELLKLVTN